MGEVIEGSPLTVGEVIEGSPLTVGEVIEESPLTVGEVIEESALTEGEAIEVARRSFIVIPAKAGIQRLFDERHWVPAFAETTALVCRALPYASEPARSR